MEPNAHPLPPFVGRETAFSRLQQHLTHPTSAVLFLGRRQIGKTALLRQFATLPGIVGLYMPLRHLSLRTEDLWLNALIETTIANAQAHQLLPTMLEVPAGEPLRTWYTDTCLPVLMRMARHQWRFLLLLDDIEVMAEAVTAGHLPADTFTFLHSLINPQVGMVLTTDLQHEDRVTALAPLVDARMVHRLTSLPYAESALLFPEAPVETLNSVYQATGGEPVLLQQYRALVPDMTSTTPEDIKQLNLEIYNQNEQVLELAWRQLNRNERLVLTAISSLRYRDPLGRIDTAKIENWMVETDYPLDATAINAALRGLEYDDLVEASVTDVKINAGLMQKWLLENALLGIEAPREPGAAFPTRFVVVAVVVALVMIAVMAVLLTTNEREPAPMIPTVTLLPNE
ncbi:MAG: hypothetical protein OHK0046_48890 [Anaerolineae bacterium]